MLTAVTNATGNSAGAKLRCLYTKAQSLISKLDELKLCLVELSPDVLAVTETWLSGNISDNEVALPGHQIYRRDREHRQGGGIVVYVNEGLAVSDNTTKFACNTEAIWLAIKATGSPSLDVLSVYRSPRTNRIADTQLLEQLVKFSSRSNIMIMGDFNAPGTNWNTLQASGPKSAFDYRLLSKTLNACLTQHVMFPTRTREGQRANCLDLVFTKSPDSLDEINSMPPLGRSDHVVLMWDYSLFSISHTPDHKRRNVWRGDFNQMRADLSGLDWGSLITGSANDDWELFKNVLLQLINNHCPLTGDLAVETIELLLREKYDDSENHLGHAQIIQLLKFCLKTYFTFDGTIYEPMGLPISGTHSRGGPTTAGVAGFPTPQTEIMGSVRG
nr:unnamed protein product [Spirometra erinaceieuropaei]